MTSFQHRTIVAALFVIASGLFVIAGGVWIGVGIILVVSAGVIAAQKAPVKLEDDQ